MSDDARRSYPGFEAPDGTYYSYRERSGRWHVFNFTPLHIDFSIPDGPKKARQTITEVGPEDGFTNEAEADSLARRLAGAPPADNEEVNRALEAWMGGDGLDIVFDEPGRAGEPFTATLAELGLSASAATQEAAFEALIDAIIRFVESYVFAGKPLPPRLSQRADADG